MDFREFRSKQNSLTEKVEKVYSGKTVKDPPHVLVLRRTGIRIFPTGEKVALYTSNKLDMTFSVPYNTQGGSVVAVSEEVLVESNVRVMDQLQHIVDKNEMKEVRFRNGATTRVDTTTAKFVLQLHAQLTPDNQKKLSSMVNKTPENLAQVSAFAFKNLQ